MFEIRVIFLAAAAMAWFVQPVSATLDTSADQVTASAAPTVNSKATQTLKARSD